MKLNQRIKIKDLLDKKPIGQEITVKGWIRTKRGNKQVVFIALNDGSCIYNLQVVVDVAQLELDTLKHLSTGASISVQGKVKESSGKEQTT